MSVISYLEATAGEAVLSSTEKNSIQRSVQNLQSYLGTYFGKLHSHFQFGSSTRGTILPRTMDEHSDIDYMVVFGDAGLAPQAYLDRLKKFAEKYYARSEIRQASPTIVLELNHIKFELVPALPAFLSGFKIPNGSQGWQSTDPNDFNSSLTAKNKDHSNLIKPTIRLAKYWNAENSYVFDSYSFEKWIVGRSFFWCVANQRDYLFDVFDGLSVENQETQWRKNKIARAKDIVAEVRRLEKSGSAVAAELEIKKLIPY